MKRKQINSVIIQTKNPRTGKYMKIDRLKGQIMDFKKSDGPYKNIPVLDKRSDI